MSTLNAIRAKNLRSLVDTQELPIRKINLLVGRNSGGKSTFARILPLIRQSTEVRKRSPVLWYGRLVDFGSFHDSVRDSDPSNEIELSFRLQLDKNSTGLVSTSHEFEDSYDVLAAITLTDERKSVGTIVSKLEITFEGINSILSFEKGKLVTIQVADLVEIINPALQQTLSFTGLLPVIDVFKREKIKVGEQEFFMPVRSDVFIAPLLRDISALAKVNIGSDGAETLAKKFSYGSDQEILAQLHGNSDGPPKWISFCKSVDKKGPIFERIRNSILMANLPQLMAAIDETISDLAKNVSYLEPLRATAQRYYRRQELAVDELDSRGENVPFFLDNLSTYEKSRLDKWLIKNFGISVETESSGGHIAIRLKIQGSNKAVNLADAGFGYSQILPIALQLWHLTQGSVFSATTSDAHNQKIVVMEQPELHLHPAIQSKLADIFAASVNESYPNYNYQSPDLRIIVETHSPSLINRVGELVSMGSLNPMDVQVILFEKDESTGMTTTRVAEYAEDGRLKNWPYGFFEALDDYEINSNKEGD